MRRKGLGPLLFFVLLTIASLAYTLIAGNAPVLGLDLQGGVSVVLQPTEDLPEGATENLDQAVEIIRNRVDALGVAEPDITRQGDTVLVQLPGVKDQDRAIELVGQTAELRFRPVLLQLPPCGDEPAVGCPNEDQITTTTAATTTTVPGTTVPGGAAPTTTVPATPTTEPAATTTTAATGEGEQGLAGLTPGENAGAFQPTTTVPPATTTPTTTPATTAPGTPTTAPAGEPSATTVPGVPPTTAPATDSEATCAGVDDATPQDPTTGFPTPNLGANRLEALGLNEYGLDESGVTPRGRDVACNTVVLPQIDNEGDGGIVSRYVLGPTQVLGNAVDGAEAVLDQQTGTQWTVTPSFKGGSPGIDQFNAITTRCFAAEAVCPTQQLAIVLDQDVVSAPSITETPTFERDEIVISGSFTEESAKDLALVLRYGALPVTLEPQDVRTVSATLGEDSLRAGLISGIIGLVLTIIFMVGYYRLLGVVAIASLVLEFGLVWVIIAWLGESRGLALTLAGVTGLIVSIGISVDSNVVFYEHLKEDVRNGRTFRSTVERSFDSSFATIIKADIASLIGAVLLYYLSVGPVRGFALLLGISTIIDIFASWFFIRPAVLLLARSPRWRERTTVFGMPKVEEAT